MDASARVLAVVCSLGIGSSALAQESRTMGHRMVAVGDVVHRTQDMRMDAEATMSIDNVTATPVVLKMQMGDIFDLKIEAVRVPTNPKGPIYRVEVLRLEATVPMKGTQLSTLAGRTLVVDMTKHKVKPADGPKLTQEESDRLFSTMDSLGNPFVGGGARWTDHAPATFTVGQHVDPAELGGDLPRDLPAEMSVVVRGFESGPQGERVILDVSMGGTIQSDGVPMEIQMGGTMQLDVATGWPLGADLHGDLSVDDTAVNTDTMNMHMSMKGPIQMLIASEFTTVDGRAFGYGAK